MLKWIYNSNGQIFSRWTLNSITKNDTIEITFEEDIHEDDNKEHASNAHFKFVERICWFTRMSQPTLKRPTQPNWDFRLCKLIIKQIRKCLVLCTRISKKNTQTSWVWKRSKGEKMFWLIAPLDANSFRMGISACHFSKQLTFI